MKRITSLLIDVLIKETGSMARDLTMCKCKVIVNERAEVW
jgi:hypothetical protein